MDKTQNINKKIKKYAKKLERLKRARLRTESRSRTGSRSRTRSRSPIRLTENFTEEIDDGRSLLDESDIAVAQPDPLAPFREALGLKKKEESDTTIDNMPEDIGCTWNDILTNGLKIEERDSILKNNSIPKNCQLLEAPTLNDEVKVVLTESSKGRDHAVEANQHQLGVATGIIGNVITNLVGKENIDKIQTVGKLHEAAKLLNDIHFQNTKSRRQLIAPLMDKSFNHLVEKVKRDELLFGSDLITKIRSNQELIKSCSQIRKIAAFGKQQTQTSKNIKPKQGNYYGPPRPPTKSAAPPRGGPENRARQPTRHQTKPASNVPAYRSKRAAARGAHNRR